MNSPKTIARPYAQAAFDLAVQQGHLSAWHRFLHFAAGVVDDPYIKLLIDHPRAKADDIIDLFFLMLQKEYLDPYQQAFLKILAQQWRLKVLPEIVNLFEGLQTVHDEIMQVSVTSAFALTTTQKRQLERALDNKFKKKSQCQYQVDSTILGGAIIRVGDVVIDGSGRAQLERLKKSILGEGK